MLEFSIGLLLLSSALTLGFALHYLFTKSWLHRHGVIAQMAWTDVPPRVRLIILAMMRVIGAGLLSLSVTLAWLAVPLAPGLIQQQQASPFHIHYRPVVLPPERHRGYALQWGLIALAVIGVALAASARRLPIESGEIAHEQS